MLTDHPVDDALGRAMVEVGHLEGKTGEDGGGQFEQDAPAWYADHLDVRTELPQVFDVRRIGRAVAQAAEDDAVAFGQPGDQVVGPQLIALLEWIGDAGKQHQELHALRNRS